MPAPTRQLSINDAWRIVHDAAVARPPGDPATVAATVGVELEWLVMDVEHPTAQVPLAVVDDELVTRSLPARGRVTFEPGGQLELSSRPARGVGPACDATAADAATLSRRLRRRNVALVALGRDPLRPPVRAVRSARYDAMESYFSGFGIDGSVMMCSTAAVQVNVALHGPGDGGDRDPVAHTLAGRWQRAHLAGPVLAAAFANSPIAGGRPSGWRSSRLATWAAMDPSRTRAVAGADPGSAWADYALDARVMLIRHATSERDGASVVRNPITLREWIEHGSPWGWPDRSDVEYHLTTLFPPVRPRGWLELRMVDALPDPWWRVAVAVGAAAVDDRIAADVVAACAPVDGLWEVAARHGLAHPGLATAAQALFRAARAVLADIGGDATLADALDEFTARYVALGRTPADDRLDDWAGSGTCIPDEHPPRERATS